MLNATAAPHLDTLRMYKTLLCCLPALAMAVCKDPMRVRLSWEMMKADGTSELYAEAVSLAIETGYQELFANIHNEQGQNVNEAHNAAGFIFWHRRYLLAYENMLRSLDERFECLTLPYWNYFSHYEQMNPRPKPGDALAIASIMREMPQGDARRGPWHSKASFPGSASIDYLTNALNVPTYDKVAKNIERTFHNSLHGWLGGTMGTYQSPRDPIFFAHHATVDLAHALFYKCRTDPRSDRTDEFKKTSPIAYVPYGRHAPDINGGFHMYYRNGSVSVPVEEIDSLQPFFASLPSFYYQYVDTQELNDAKNATSSCNYRYVLDPLLQSVLDSIDCVPRPAEEEEEKPRIFPNVHVQNELHWRDVIRHALTGLESTEIAYQLNIMHCVMHAERYGLDDYSTAFRSAFGIPPHEHAPCISTVKAYHQAIEKNSTILHLQEHVWRRIFNAFKRNRFR